MFDQSEKRCSRLMPVLDGTNQVLPIKIKVSLAVAGLMCRFGHSASRPARHKRPAAA
jgi:hypothetical protein